jgi:predicted O-linked N-acetylglucosamine transferase (SPINDLY family)
VTFGSLNNLCKVNEAVLACWAGVLRAAKQSRLLMFCPAGAGRERICRILDAHGVSSDRLEFHGRRSWPDYLRLFHRMDIALDSFPVNGMTTSCHALWMGVPVLTLPGVTPASRAGLGLLSTVGLAELAADSEESMARIAVELAGDLPRLSVLRATMRDRMRGSALMDAPRFARNVESAYRDMWRRWCAGK